MKEIIEYLNDEIIIYTILAEKNRIEREKNWFDGVVFGMKIALKQINGEGANREFSRD